MNMGYLSDCCNAKVHKGGLKQEWYCQCGKYCTIHEVKEEPVKEEKLLSELEDTIVMGWADTDAKKLMLTLIRDKIEKLSHPPVSEGEVSERDFETPIRKEFPSHTPQWIKGIANEYYQFHLRGTAKLREEIERLKKENEDFEQCCDNYVVQISDLKSQLNELKK